MILGVSGGKIKFIEFESWASGLPELGFGYLISLTGIDQLTHLLSRPL